MNSAQTAQVPTGWELGTDDDELGLVESLDGAKELADDYMQADECENR